MLACFCLGIDKGPNPKMKYWALRYHFSIRMERKIGVFFFPLYRSIVLFGLRFTKRKLHKFTSIPSTCKIFFILFAHKTHPSMQINDAHAPGAYRAAENRYDSMQYRRCGRCLQPRRSPGAGRTGRAGRGRAGTRAGRSGQAVR